MERVESASVQPSTTTQSAESSQAVKSLKRKFEDAIHVLDNAVRPSSFAEPLPSSKKLRPSRSLYATLAKYGIKKDAKLSAPQSPLESLSKSAPHLVAILSRAPKARPSKPGSVRISSAPNITTPGSDYRPSSIPAFLMRLATYKLTTYANKPAAIDAVAAAKCGWINEGKDRLMCGICNVSWVLASKDGLHKDTANALVEKQRVQLVEMHKDGCPWKARQCDASIYRVPLSTPAAMAKELKSRAITLDTAVKDVQIKHPLTAAQAQTLYRVINTLKLHDNITLPDDASTSLLDAEPASISAPLLVAEPSDTAVTIALFGWSLAAPPPMPRTSVSRATSIVPSTPRTSPGLSSRGSTPFRSTPRPPLSNRSPTSLNLSTPSTSIKPDATMLCCALCQRRIGLWAFTQPSSSSSHSEQNSSQTRRQLDVLREHRSYCPYVVRSTVIPSLPVPPFGQNSSTTSLLASSPSPKTQLGGSGELEGWRAVLSVILRYGATQRQRLGYSRTTHRTGRPSVDSTDSVDETSEDVEEIDRVAAMVEGVKMHGGRDLLRYVKGLLG